jgi:hypothetical protein
VKHSLIEFGTAFVPAVMDVLKIRILDPSVSEQFQSMVEDTVNYREKTGFKRNDFMQLLIEVRSQSKMEEVNGKCEQNIDGNMEDKSDEIGMYLEVCYM